MTFFGPAAYGFAALARQRDEDARRDDADRQMWEEEQARQRLNDEPLDDEDNG